MDPGIYAGACLPRPRFLGQIGDGNGFFSELVLTNPSPDFSVSGIVRFLDDEGDALPIGLAANGGARLAAGVLESEASSSVINIPPLGSTTLETDGLGALMVGSAVLMTNGSVGAVIRWNDRQDGETPRPLGAVGESESLQGFIMPVRWSPGDINTGAMHNTDVVPGTFELTLRDQEGNERGTTMVTLPPGGHRAQFLDELFGQDALRNPAGSRNPQTHFRGGEFFTGTVVGIMTNVASLNDSSLLDEDSRERAIDTTTGTGFAPRGWAVTGLQTGGGAGVFHFIPVTETEFSSLGGDLP